MVVHQPRQPDRRDRHAAGRPQEQELVLGHLRVKRPLRVLPPFGQEAVEADRIDDGAGQDVGADLRALLDHHDGEVAARLRGELLQADRGREPGRPAARDHDIVFHHLPIGQFHHPSPLGPTSPSGPSAIVACPAKLWETAATVTSSRAASATSRACPTGSLG
jgi:hypothetical protein